MTESAIEIRGLQKSYGGRTVISNLDLAVEAGTVLAFLGPNGAGKTTTVEILEGFRGRDAGEITVLGVDPAKPTRAWRQRIGIVLQQVELEKNLTVAELLACFAGYYENPRNLSELLELVELGDKQQERIGYLSGGQRRRLDVALALVGDPDLIFLDEPTTGFDPAARRTMWKTIAGLRDLGKTVFLTTHYMDEAQQLADRVVILRGGQIVADGTPGQLGEGSPTQIRFHRFVREIQPPALEGASPVLDADRWIYHVDSPTKALHELTSWALQEKIDLDAIQVQKPTLEQIYLDITTVSDGDFTNGERKLC